MTGTNIASFTESDEPSSYRIMLVALPVVLLVAGAFWYALSLIQPPPQKVIVMSTGSKSGGFHAFGLRYKAALEREGVKVELVNSAGSVENLQRLKDPKSNVTAALIQGGIGSGEDNAGLVSVGRMFYEPVWIFYGGSETLRRLSQLRERKIAVGAAGSGTRVLATEILKRANVTSDNASLLTMDKDSAVKSLFAGEIDAIVLAFAPEAPALRELLHDPRVRLMSLDQADAMVRLLPYLSKVTLPSGVFDLERNLPSEPVNLVAPVASLVVRQELHPALVGLLAKVATQVHGGPSLVQNAGSFPIPDDPVFEMSDDAERFYRSGQPLLQRLFPFWLANFIERALVLVVPLATIAIPIVKGIPALYRWRIRQRLDYWYGRLRQLEAAIVRGEARELTQAHRAELDRIDTAVGRLNVPKAFAEAYYNLRSHIDFVRERLARGG
jgi:TRAP-type uncharacterized transport system substrate-binding protein